MFPILVSDTDDIKISIEQSLVIVLMDCIIVRDSVRRNHYEAKMENDDGVRVCMVLIVSFVAN